MGIQTDRRSFLAAAPVLAAATALPATASVYNRDAGMEHAWKCWKSCHTAMAALPGDADDQFLWGQIDGAEKVIRSSLARTPRGVTIQILLSLCHTQCSHEMEAAIVREDLGWFHQHDPELDWNDRMLVAALRSLDGLGALGRLSGEAA